MVNRNRIVRKTNKHTSGHGRMQKKALVCVCLLLLFSACQRELYTNYEQEMQEGTLGEVRKKAAPALFYQSCC
jgi:hypothetical protein